MKKNNVGIVIPIYKKQLTNNEELSLIVTLKALRNYDIYLMTYRGIDLTGYLRYRSFRVVYFSSKFFENVHTYSRLLLSPFFYLKFIKYKYICIVQSDAVVLGPQNKLDEFVGMGYDYIGAPWKDGFYIHRFQPGNHFPILKRFPAIKRMLMGDAIRCYIGNGGLSLRNVKSTIKLLIKYWFFRITWFENEDLFYSFFGTYDKKAYKLAPVGIARLFSLETTAEKDIERGIIPFGIHAWERYCISLKDKLSEIV